MSGQVGTGMIAFFLWVSLMAFQLSTPAFQPNAGIPKKYTCDGPDVSPALRWSDPLRARRRWRSSATIPMRP